MSLELDEMMLVSDGIHRGGRSMMNGVTGFVGR